MHRIGEIHGFICTQPGQQSLVHSDEFGLLLKNCSLADATVIAGHILSAIHAYRFESDGSLFDITASIGIAPIDAQSQNITGVMGAADLACYVAKDLGRNRVHVYHADDRELSSRHHDILRAAELRDRLHRLEARLLAET